MQLLLNTIMLEPNRWRQDHALTQPLTLLVPRLAAAGFTALELWQYHISALDAGQLDELRGALKTHGIRAVALGAYPLLHLEGDQAEAAAADLAGLVETAAVLGCTTFKIFPGRVASDQLDASQRALAVDRLLALASALAERRMQLTLETHARTLCDTPASTVQLLEELRPTPNAGLCFQPYGDQDTAAALALFDRLAPAVRHIHLQNRRGPERTCTRLADGDWIDCSRLLQHVRDSGFDELLSLEFTAGLFAPEGEAFDPQIVIDNAACDRAFVEAVWGGSPGG